MRKVFLGTGIIIEVAAMIFIISCNNEDIAKVDQQQLTISDNEFNIETNILVFNSKENFFNTIDEIIDMNEAELDVWENEKGFTSIRSINNLIMEELELAETEEEIYNIVNQYPQFCEIITNDDGEQEFRLIFNYKVYSAIANEDGYFVTGEKINKVTSNYIVTTELEMVDKIKEINTNNIDKYLNDKEISFYNFAQSLSEYTEAKGCGHKSISATQTLDKRKCRNDRRVRIDMEVVGYAYSGQTTSYRIDASVKVKGYKKYVCIWGGYKTYLEYEDCEGDLYTSDGIVSFDLGKGSDNDVRTLEYEKNVYNKDGSYQGSYYFDDVYGKASSRGVDNLWAVIDCPYGK